MALSDEAIVRLPSVDAVLRSAAASEGIDRHGRALMVAAVRATLADLRANGAADATSIDHVARAACNRAARDAAMEAMREATNLEYDVTEGRRGERDDHVRDLIRRVTGAEASVLVNNNAAAVILTLNTLANGRETIVSRGELVEIGGSFRMPEIMARAGTRLREVGATNRTHPHDYKQAIGPETALLMKVHTSNFLIKGFASSVEPRDVAAVAHEAGLPFVDDLGSGVLVDLADYGLEEERTVQSALRDGADLVTFSGDKLLGGPQTGFVVGRTDLIDKLKKNPLKRALRLDKIRLAALEATLRLYLDPVRLAERLPTLRLLTRPKAAIQALAEEMRAPMADALGPLWTVVVVDCDSETGSGALPLAGVPSAGLAAAPVAAASRGRALDALAAAFRALPRPVIGRIHQDRFILDFRCLEDGQTFKAQLGALRSPDPS